MIEAIESLRTKCCKSSRENDGDSLVDQASRKAHGLRSNETNLPTPSLFNSPPQHPPHNHPTGDKTMRKQDSLSLSSLTLSSLRRNLGEHITPKEGKGGKKIQGWSGTSPPSPPTPPAPGPSSLSPRVLQVCDPVWLGAVSRGCLRKRGVNT